MSNFATILLYMFELNEKQVEQMSNYSSSLSVLFLGSALTPVFSQVDNPSPLVIVLGMILAVGYFVVSIALLKGIK